MEDKNEEMRAQCNSMTAEERQAAVAKALSIIYAGPERMTPHEIRRFVRNEATIRVAELLKELMQMNPAVVQEMIGTTFEIGPELLPHRYLIANPENPTKISVLGLINSVLMCALGDNHVQARFDKEPEKLIGFKAILIDKEPTEKTA